MDNTLVFLFSGQGSQYFNMGKDLYYKNRAFRDAFDFGDEWIRKRLGISLVQEVYCRTAEDAFDDLLLSNLALLNVQYAVFQSLLNIGVFPDKLCGFSFGELAAAVAAGVWSLQSAFEIVIEHVSLIEAYCPRGGMTSILADIGLYAELREEGCEIELAGINFKTHFTVSGADSSLSDMEKRLRSRGILFQRLPVHYAFHSSAIDPIKNLFIKSSFLQEANEAPKISLISGVLAAPVQKVTPESVWASFREPIRFSEVVKKLEISGKNMFIDCGPSGTLATFAKYNLTDDSRSQCFPILTQFHQGMERLEELKNYARLYL